MLRTMERERLDIVTPACVGSGWRVMMANTRPSNATSGRLSYFYEPFFAAYTRAAWRCRQRLIAISQRFGKGSMRWDKYIYAFCGQARIGIIPSMAVHHTQVGGKAPDKAK